MNVGTKSLLIGVHQFLLHPLLVAIAWWKLYGVPWDPRLWLAFVVHDLGYWGKPNMDGPEGEKHVEWGACFMDTWFGQEWGSLCRYHSRFAARRDGKQFSRLCVADKLVTTIEPWWLYLPRARLSGELSEYMSLTKASSEGSKYATMHVHHPNEKQWYLNIQRYLAAWVEEHKDCRPDTWTPTKGETT